MCPYAYIQVGLSCEYPQFQAYFGAFLPICRHLQSLKRLEKSTDVDTKSPIDSVLPSESIMLCKRIVVVQ
jgi:hypothetical protein